ncbi:hypothetical protein [Clostridium tagluense]|uniref:Uncharacterized protein n=1 Tax=Clostridium tagluense TaxID=360422 RepID=A0A401USB5_9CLOT|nr:hypothetical protein [Clostridium tagluense]GCD12404.1 hypothetical protein Ctaglu_40270 [Clostridium tagluense]
MRVSKEILEVLALNDMYIRECKGNKWVKYIIGRNGRMGEEYFRTTTNIKFYLGMLRYEFTEEDGKRCLQESKYSLEDIKRERKINEKLKNELTEEEFKIYCGLNQKSIENIAEQVALQVNQAKRLKI